ncbi:MAG TPA: FliM/FliN family flagellar motor switch protein [Gemmatimonadaceae bacterium]|nr:FliM/FliN family flagellar motor switch protein [Gemmatimonadaceae bacterium]
MSTARATNQSLSQNDIDRLLGGPRDGVAAARPVTDVQVYDFRRPHRVSRERLRTLEAMYERLVKSFEGWLVARVRDTIELSLQSVEQISFGEFLLSLPVPCSSFIVDIKHGQQGVVDFGREFSYFLVDRLFGGGGGSAPAILDRALTPIERMAIRVVGDRLLALVAEIWQEQVPLELTIGGFETIPEIIQANQREDPVLVVNIAATFTGASSLISICLPLSVLEKFFLAGAERAPRAIGSEQERDETRVITETTLRRTRVPIAARLPEFRLSMRDVLGLQAGSILSTGVPTDAPLSVLVGTQPRFTAGAGKVGQSRAVRIIDTLTAPDSPRSSR